MSILTYVDGAGVLRDVSSAQPLPTTGTGSGPSVGLTGSTAPTSADEIGWVDGSGNLVNVSAATPLPVSATVNAEEIVLNVTGSATSAAVLINFPITTTGYRTASVQVTNAGSGCTLIAEQSNDGTTWYGIQTPTDLVAEAATPLTAVGLYNFPVSAKQFRMRCSVYGSGTPAVNVQFRLAEIDYAQQAVALAAGTAVIGHVIVDSGSITANAGTNLNTSALALDATLSAFKAANHTDVTQVNSTLGSPFQAGGSIGNTTFAATQSGTWTVQPGNTANTTAWKVDGSAVTQPVSAASLPLPTGASTAAKQPALGTAGSASADVISIQGVAAMTKILVTPDSVALPANQSVNVAQIAGSTTDTNTGNASAGSQRVVLATNQPAVNTSPDNVVDGVVSTASVTSATTIQTFSNLVGVSYIAFGFTSVGAGNTIAVDTAPDGSTFNGTAIIQRADNPNTAGVASVVPTAAMIFWVPVTAQAMRIRCSAYGSGTVTLYAVLKRIGTPAVNAIVASGSVASAAADSGNPVKVAGRYNSTPITLTNAQRGDLQMSPTGATLVEEAGRTFSHISTNATTTSKSGAGYLHSITINTRGVGNTATVYDNTAGSGTVIAVLDTTLSTTAFVYDLLFSTGLTVVTAGGTPPDLTVVYR